MKTGVCVCGRLLILAGTTWMWLGNQGLARSANAEDAEALAKNVEWKWDKLTSVLSYSLQQMPSTSEFGWRLSSDLDRRDVLELTFVNKSAKTTVWSTQAHWSTVFRTGGKKIYIVQSPAMTYGGKVLCIDGSSGRMDWECPIGAILKVGSHSLYVTSRAIELTDDFVLVWGNETGGRFLDVIDRKTGRLLASRKFEEAGMN
jgi:hypothetical protein